jgi:hypothetical protein
VWVSDDAKFTTSSGVKPATLGPPVTVRWVLYRSVPGTVKFANDRPQVEKIADPGAPFSGKATPTASFSKPGEYMLYVVATQYSG